MSISKEDLRVLYSSGMSMAEISSNLKCSIHKVVYWMDKHGISKRTRSEAMYVKLNPFGDPFNIKKRLNRKEKFLFGLGLGIYWGEGEKTSKHLVRVANTNAEILKTFIKFLLTICQLNKNKLLYSIICFNDSYPNDARRYWSKELSVLPEKFGKIVQILPQGKGTYKRKSQFGVCTVTVANIKLKAWIIKELKNI